MNKLLFVVCLGIVNIIFSQESPILKSEYFGQTPPGLVPEAFARGIISTNYKEHGSPTFSADGKEVFWWSIQIDSNNQWINLFKTMRCVGDTWTEPVNMGQTINSDRLDRFPSVSPDGKYFFYTQSTPGTNEDVYWVSTK